MYTGQQHRYVLEGFQYIRLLLNLHYAAEIMYNPPLDMELRILSAAYGVLEPNTQIVPYNLTFQGQPHENIVKRSQTLHIHQDIQALLPNFDLVFYLLGKEYVMSLELPMINYHGVTQIFLLGPHYARLLPKNEGIHLVSASGAMAAHLNVMGIALKGYLFKTICEEAFHRSTLDVFSEIKANPQRILEIAQNPTPATPVFQNEQLDFL